MAERSIGTICRVFPERLYGFVLTREGEEVFIHQRDFRPGVKAYFRRADAEAVSDRILLRPGTQLSFLRVPQLEGRRDRAIDALVATEPHSHMGWDEPSQKEVALEGNR